jgi:hypothetical protein
MDAITKLEFSDERFQTLIRPLVGLACCRSKVGGFFSLSLGFGKLVPIPMLKSGRRLNTAHYGEWEIGSYFCSWRVIRRSDILYSGSNNIGSESELDERIANVDFGCFMSIVQLSKWDVRIECTADLFIDFLGIDSHDESFHVFCPNNVSIVFKPGSGWFVGPSNKPWEA